MKRLMLTLSSLTLISTACGGRGNLRNDLESDEGDGTSTSGGRPSTSSGGASASSGGKPAGKGGSPNSGMVNTSKGGTSTMMVPSPAGAPSGGTFALGGDTGSGGAFDGDPQSTCARYCRSYLDVCPQAGVGPIERCYSDCVDALTGTNAPCVAGRRSAYACIANALAASPDDCNAALALATRECGGASPPLDRCNVTCTAQNIYGGGADGCHATADCDGVALDLNCRDAGDTIPCTCSLDGKPVWKIGTGFANYKLGCIDDALFELCAQALPP